MSSEKDEFSGSGSPLKDTASLSLAGTSELSSGMSESKKITLMTRDNVAYQVDEGVAMEMEIVKRFFNEDVSRDAVVPLPNVTSDTMEKILEYCVKRIEFRSKSAAAVDDGAREEVKKEMKAFDAEFLKNKSVDDVAGLILSANFLNVPDLLEILFQFMADQIKGKSTQYVRDLFGIVDSGFTSEEERELRERDAWAYDTYDDYN